MLTRFILIASFLFMGTLAAQDLSQPLTLGELVDIALQNHPSTRQVWWNANRAASVLGEAESAYCPKVGFQSSVRHGRDFKFINGPDTNYTIVGADLLLSMLLCDFGERTAKVNMASSALLAANWQADWNIQKIMVRVLENAYSTLHAQEVLQAAELSVKDAEVVANAARELNRSGLSPVSDVYTAQAGLSLMKMELSKQRAFLQIQEGKLVASLGLSANLPIKLSPLGPIKSTSMQEIDELIALALRQRTDLMAKNAELSASLANVVKTRAAYGPKLSLAGRAGPSYAFHDKETGANYQIALSFDIPLSNPLEKMYRNNVAYYDSQLSLEELAELQLEISLEVLTYAKTLAAAQEMIPEAEENLNNALKAYEGVFEIYKAGKLRISEVSTAQQQLAAARVQYSDVRTRWYQSLANLAYATGTIGSSMETQCKKSY